MRQPQLMLVQYRSPAVSPPADPALGLWFDGVVHRAPSEWPATVLDLARDWDTWAPRIRAVSPTDLTVVPDAELVAPLTYPPKVICAGANYYDHAAEMGVSRPDPAAEPYFFLKPPSTTVIGPDAEVLIPADPAARVDWEIELAVVIAHRCTNVSREQARRHILGYTIANDISARGLFHRDPAVAAAFEWDWFSHKALDTFCPLGPGIVPEWEIADPHALDLRLSVAGTVKQDSSTSNIVVDIDGLVAAASRWFTLEPGDVILTGTPAGVGLPRGEFLKDGDRMVAEIDGIGALVNAVTAR